MHVLYQFSEGYVTQVSCDARIVASSQILAILLLLFGAFLEIETRKRNKNEISANITVTASDDSPKPQNEIPFVGSVIVELVPDDSIKRATTLVICPIIKIDAEYSTFGCLHLLGLFPDLFFDLDFTS